MKPLAPPLFPSIGLDKLQQVAETAAGVVDQVRKSMLAPTAVKSPPIFSAPQLAELCGVDRSTISRLSRKGDLPGGTAVGSRKEWTLAEATQWVRHIKADRLRNDYQKTSGVVITIANFKGGVTKTTTAATLAQGLSLRGHKVLLIDCDPQGSLTTLFGVLPDTEVAEDQTILPLCAGDDDSILRAVQKTYWEGIDLVAAAPFLYNAEFMLPARQTSEQNFSFWNVLNDGLDMPARIDLENYTEENAHEYKTARDIYDCIIIDSPPSLSYLTINGLMAADGILMPLPPNALDFSSSSIFWRLFTDVVGGLLEKGGQKKEYRFVDILLSRVDRSDAVSGAVRQWIMSAYGGMVLPVEIPKTSTAATASAEFGTVYDLNSGSALAKTLNRAKEAYESMVDYVEHQIHSSWAADLQASAEYDKKSGASK